MEPSTSKASGSGASGSAASASGSVTPGSTEPGSPVSYLTALLGKRVIGADGRSCDDLDTPDAPDAKRTKYVLLYVNIIVF